MTDNTEISRTALVIGASGGLGSALCQALVDGADFDTVLAVSRTRPAVAVDGYFRADTTCSRELSAAADQVRTDYPKLHLLLNCTGMLADGDALQPEKALRDLQRDNFLRLMEVNALAPLLALQTFADLLRHDQPSLAVVLSAMVGSISDNRLGGWYSYRMSKAALNMGIRNAAIELGRVGGGPVVVAVHPGTTLTGLSREFVSRHRHRTPQESAQHILRLIDGLSADDSGRFFNWDGNEIAW